MKLVPPPRSLLCVLWILCGLASIASAQAPPLPADLPLIVTTGEAVVRRPPDRAFVTVSVETRAKSPREAQRLNADAMAEVQQRLAAARVAKEAIRTSGYDLQQEFDFNQGRRIPREFVARNAIEVRVDEVARTGEIMDVAVQGGATSLAGIRFDLQDRTGAEREALRQAVADARARADAAAAGAGRTVDRVIRVEDSREMIAPPRPMMTMARVAAEAAPAPTPVEPGSVEIHARVTLTVAMK